MKKLTLFVILLGALFANDGKTLFEQNCASCHITTKPTPEQRKNMVAPPIAGVMWHVKERFKTKDEAVRFIVDYVQNPSQEKALCPSVRRFGLMPKLSLPKETLQKIADYIYDTYPPKGFVHPKKMKWNMPR